MESNYLKSVMIKIKQHPEWDKQRIFEEISKAYGKEVHACYLTKNNNILIIPTPQDLKPIKMIYEGEQNYEK